MKKWLILGLLAGGLSFPSRVLACDMCSIFSALETKSSELGFYGGVFEQYSDFGTLRDDGEKVPNELDQKLESSITQVLVGYQFHHRFGLQVNVPYVDRSFTRPEGEEIESGSERGLGDVTLLAHYRAYERYEADSAFVLNLLAGLKLPTGDSDRLGEEHSHEGEEDDHEHEGEDEHGDDHGHGEESGVHSHDLALGSGSLDGVIGFSGHLNKKRVFLRFETQYAIRTEGDFDYQFANDLTLSINPGVFAWIDGDRSLAVGVDVFAEKKGKDTHDGEPLPDTGIEAIYAGPQLTYTNGRRLHLEMTFDLPIEQETTALQIVPDWRLRLGLIARF